MNNPRLAQRYAKSLIDIATQYNKLEEVYKDISFLKAIVVKNRDFVLMLESPIISPDKKYKIINAITSGNISNITDTFLKLICTKGREPNLPGIINSFIEQYNVITGIHIAKLTTATPASNELKQSFVSKIKASTSFENVQLLDFECLKGQLLSSSYIPLPGQPSYENMISELAELFVAYNENGYIRMEYETKIYMNQERLTFKN